MRSKTRDYLLLAAVLDEDLDDVDDADEVEEDDAAEDPANDCPWCGKPDANPLHKVECEEAFIKECPDRI